jgi:hypothetical protein
MFMEVVGTIPPAASFSGKKGKAELEDLLEKMQVDLFALVAPPTESASEEWRGGEEFDMLDDAPAAVSKDNKKDKKKKGKSKGKAKQVQAEEEEEPPMAKTMHMLPCPTCAEQVTRLKYQEYIAQRATTVFSPCVYYSWDGTSLPALFTNPHQYMDGRKPKWGLVQGVAPPSLELDSSRSGSLYKPALKAFLDPPQRALPFQRRMEGAKLCAEGEQWVEGFADKHALLSSFWDCVDVCAVCGQAAKEAAKSKDGGDGQREKPACEQHHTANAMAPLDGGEDYGMGELSVGGNAGKGGKGAKGGKRGKATGGKEAYVAPADRRVLFLTREDYERLYDAFTSHVPACVRFTEVVKVVRETGFSEADE